MGPKEISEMATTSVATAQQSSFTNQILHGDCIQVMRQMPANSVDFILADPRRTRGFFAIHGGNAYLCASTAREAHMIFAPHLCRIRHNLCLSIIDADGMTGMKK
jgi:hypothetical protein